MNKHVGTSTQTLYFDRVIYTIVREHDEYKCWQVHRAAASTPDDSTCIGTGVEAATVWEQDPMESIYIDVAKLIRDGGGSTPNFSFMGYMWILDEEEICYGDLHAWITDRKEGHYSGIDVSPPTRIGIGADGRWYTRQRVVVESSCRSNDYVRVEALPQGAQGSIPCSCTNKHRQPHRSCNMGDETYNGWFNRSTWAMNLHMSNQGGDYEYWSEIAATCHDNNEDHDDAVRELADHLETWLDELYDMIERAATTAGEQVTAEAWNLMRDVGLNTNACHINYKEIAAAWLDDLD